MTNSETELTNNNVSIRVNSSLIREIPFKQMRSAIINII